MRYRKKPVEVEAILFTGDNWSKVCDFIGVDDVKHEPRGIMKYYIVTLEGRMELSVGDYVIRGIEGEHYPCKPSIFEKTYEPIL